MNGSGYFNGHARFGDLGFQRSIISIYDAMAGID
jgi:hypothetical protein